MYKSDQRDAGHQHNKKGENNMKLEISNGDLKSVIDFMATVELGAKASRLRVRINKKLQEKMIDFGQDIEEIKHEHEGENLNKHFAELMDEKAVIDLSEHEQNINALREGIENCTAQMGGNTAIGHDAMLTELERLTEIQQSESEVNKKENGDDE